ncbi:uncharacterized protein DSM5745_09635 [Aspergillus mulundensis]|uniref:Uncharacterized protein n=1 Tax=Aspergillus mulundensis TaxID=1810919 RepID=A0A3D8QVQ2_9EURO|nr:hypothetical protein DSM5745_09635 [Aspergillus mulundensis]RDW65896.1 hypothetical protein DSM5745_09635 [Aspergillus mulundensis]
MSQLRRFKNVVVQKVPSPVFTAPQRGYPGSSAPSFPQLSRPRRDSVPSLRSSRASPLSQVTHVASNPRSFVSRIPVRSQAPTGVRSLRQTLTASTKARILSWMDSIPNYRFRSRLPTPNTVRSLPDTVGKNLLTSSKRDYILSWLTAVPQCRLPTTTTPSFKDDAPTPRHSFKDDSLFLEIAQEQRSRPRVQRQAPPPTPQRPTPVPSLDSPDVFLALASARQTGRRGPWTTERSTTTSRSASTASKPTSAMAKGTRKRKPAKHVRFGEVTVVDANHPRWINPQLDVFRR